MGPLEPNSVPLSWTWDCWDLLRTVHSVTVLGTVRAGLGIVRGTVGTVCGAVRAEFGAGGLLALTRDCT